MKVITNPTSDQLLQLYKRPLMENDEIESIVAKIFSRIKLDGDKALRELTAELDNVTLNKLYLDAKDLEGLAGKVSTELRSAIDTASDNVEKFHRLSSKKDRKQVETTPGVLCWIEERPIERVGLYIPGGTAPLISTLLMLGIPARIANCKEIIVATPPSKDGLIEPAVAYAAIKLGIDRVYLVGGAQAIAAMAYGTRVIPKVDKIFGPGNQYVTKAKQYAQRLGVAADMPAGPSEIMVVADYTAKPAFVAADLLSQAEHGPDSQVMLVTDQAEQAQRIIAELERQILQLPRIDIARKALDQSACVIIKSKEEQVRFINSYAPEHLVLSVRNPEELMPLINNAGSVFLGNFTPESAGDYASGTNHTLPTGGWAKTYSGLSVADFQRRMSVQKITKSGLYELSKAIVPIANAEGLAGHANAVNIRTERNKDVKKN